MHGEILSKVSEEINKGNAVAMATLTEVSGSSPGKQGAILCYFNDGSIMGTVGGGILEHRIIVKCKECIESGDDYLFDHDLNAKSEDTPMTCGGKVKGYVKVFKPKPKLLIIGAGHVGYNIYNISTCLDFYTIMVDDREEYANKEKLSEINEVYAGNIGNILENINIDLNTYVIIATRGHEKDLEALRVIINKNPKYIGMIGSAKKWRRVKDTLISEGVNEELLNKVYAPVGLNISNDSVSEIAFGILAEVLKVKNNGELSHRKDTK